MLPLCLKINSIFVWNKAICTFTTKLTSVKKKKIKSPLFIYNSSVHQQPPCEFIHLVLLKSKAVPLCSFLLWPLSSCAGQVRKRPNQLCALLTTFNQSSIKKSYLSSRAWPEVKYVCRRESCLCPLTDDQREASVCSYLHLTLLSHRPAHERETRNAP